MQKDILALPVSRTPVHHHHASDAVCQNGGKIRDEGQRVSAPSSCLKIRGSQISSSVTSPQAKLHSEPALYKIQTGSPTNT